MPEHWKHNFFIIWSGQAVSLLTSSIVQMAIIWYLTDISGSALILSVASLIGFFPQGLLGPFIGVYLDRHDKKTIMMISDTCIAIATLIMVIISFLGELPIWIVFMVLFIRAIGSAFHSPCLSAVTPSIVPQDQLSKCAGYSQTLQSVTYIISPVLAGLCYSLLDMKWILSLDIIGAVCAVITLGIAVIPKTAKVETKVQVFLEAKEGFLALKKERGLFHIVLLSAVFMILFMPLNALFPLMSMQHFQGTAVHASVVETSFAAGMLLGSIVLGIWGGFKRKHVTMVIATVVMGIMVSISGMLSVNGFLFFVICCFIMGFTPPFYNGPFMVLIQERIDASYLGRVFSLSNSITSITMPIGLALSGLFADTIGIAGWFFITGIGIVIIGIIHLCFPDIRKL